MPARHKILSIWIILWVYIVTLSTLYFTKVLCYFTHIWKTFETWFLNYYLYSLYGLKPRLLKIIEAYSTGLLKFVYCQPLFLSTALCLPCVTANPVVNALTCHWSDLRSRVMHSVTPCWPRRHTSLYEACWMLLSFEWLMANRSLW